jgi:molybdenum cofactor biosynthesis protein B
VTVSDTRSESTDTSGRTIRERLISAGHHVVDSRIVRDEPTEISDQLTALLALDSVEVILLNGGTGIAPRDRTFEVVQRLLEKEIDGFGELFRMLSYAEIGAAAMLSRATAGIAQGRILVSMPGSTAAVELAMDRLILPELGHMAKLLDP